MPPHEHLYGAVEAGGTKFDCAIGHGTDDIIEESRIGTRQPAETIADVLQFFEAMQLKIENTVYASSLHGRAGLLGAMLLAKRASEHRAVQA